MNKQIHIDGKGQLREITQHLAVVDLYRPAHCEPTWRLGSAPRQTVQECVQAVTEPRVR